MIFTHQILIDEIEELFILIMICQLLTERSYSLLVNLDFDGSLFIV